MKTISFIIIYIFLSSFMQGQSTYKYIAVPAKYLQNKSTESTERKMALNSLKNPFLLEKSLPPSFVKDGSVDYADFLQKGINEHGDIIFPDFPILINSKGLNLKSNTKVYFQENSKIILQPNNSPGYEILGIKNAKNIQLYYPNVIGDKTKHLADNGEWGFGISIKESNNITIENPIVSLCQGDGIYIGGSNKPSQDIVINKAFVDNSRRNGLSITSGVNIKINSSIFSNSNGKGPGAGIDIEANNNSNEINDIEITNTITFNNERCGLLVNLVNLAKGDNIKNINIDITNHTDDNSDYGMGVWLTSKKKIGKGLDGNINIINSKWLNNRTEAYRYFENDSNKVNVTFKNLKLYNKKDSIDIDTTQIQAIKNKYSRDIRYTFSN